MLYTIQRVSKGPLALATAAATSTAIRRVWKISSSVASARSYATTTLSKPRAAAVKSTTASKSKVAAGRSTKSAVKPKSIAKKKKPAVKAKAKPKKKVKKLVKKPAPKKKIPSERQKAILVRRKEAANLTELKELALFGAEPARLPVSGWTIYHGDTLKSRANELNKGNFGNVMTETSQAFKSLPPAERERLDQQALQNQASNTAVHQTWIASHSPQRIHEANLARTRLRRFLEGKRPTSSYRFSKILDPRQPKGIRRPWNIFIADRWATGELKGIPATDAMKTLRKEYLALSSDEKKKYDDLAAADKLRFEQEKQTVYQ